MNTFIEKLSLVALVTFFVGGIAVNSVLAQSNVPANSPDSEIIGEHAGLNTDSSATDLSVTPPKDLTKPEEPVEKDAVFVLLEKRPVSEPGFFNAFAWWVQHAITTGIPVNTIVLILLLPVLATAVAFVRIIVGLPGLEMLVPIALAYAFVAIGVAAGSIILAAVIAASFVSRVSLRRLSIMSYPKRSISMLFLAIFVFFALSVSSSLTVVNIREISIFPILILTLLGDSIVSVQLRKSLHETLYITSVTIAIGLIGYMLATSPMMRNTIILYPEIILFTLPINLVMGRYFGLRLAELFRFRSFNAYGSE